MVELYEHNGLMSNRKSPEQLINYIVQYMFDARDGISNYSFGVRQEEDNEIKTIVDDDVIQGYLDYKYHGSKEIVLPSWLSGFKIYILDETEVRIGIGGWMFKSEQNYDPKTFKVALKIYISDFSGVTPALFKKMITHEFRHSYDTWIEHSENTKLNSEEMANHMVHNSIFFPKDMASEYSDEDHISLLPEDFTSIEKAESIYDTIFYYIDKSEACAFLEEFNIDINEYLIDNKADVAQRLIDANNARKEPDFSPNYRYDDTNILNTIGFTEWINKRVKVYNILKTFLQQSDLIEYDVLDKLIEDYKDHFAILTSKFTMLYKEKIDSKLIIKVVNAEIIRRIDIVLKKMSDIFADKILEFSESIGNDQLDLED